MKLTQILSVATLAAFATFSLVSCKGNKTNNADGSNTETTEAAQATEQTTTSDANAAAPTATPAKSADEQALEKATEFFGWIQEINGNLVTVKNAAGDIIQVNIADAGDELIEGAPIRVYYVEAEDGTIKTATDNSKSVSLVNSYKKLLGKWATEGDKINFELRRRGKIKSTMKGTDFKSWRVVDDNNIELEASANGQTMFMKWGVEDLSDDKLTLVNGTSKIPLTRKDSNRD